MRNAPYDLNILFLLTSGVTAPSNSSESISDDPGVFETGLGANRDLSGALATTPAA